MAGDVVALSSYKMRMWLYNSNILVLLLLFACPRNVSPLQDVTADLFGDENYGTVAAFGDFYADKQTDMFIIRERKLTNKNSVLLSFCFVIFRMCGVNVTLHYLYCHQFNTLFSLLFPSLYSKYNTNLSTGLTRQLLYPYRRLNYRAVY